MPASHKGEREGDGHKKCNNYRYKLVSMRIFLQKDCDGGVHAMDGYCNFIWILIGWEQSITPSLAEQTGNLKVPFSRRRKESCCSIYELKI